MSAILIFDGIENKDDVYWGKDCMRKFCKSLKEHVVKITNFEKKKIITLTNKEIDSHTSQENCQINKLKINMLLRKKYRWVIDHCHYTGKYRGAAYSISNLKYNTPKKIPVVFHNGSNYDISS